jgi:hypothetical protein
MASELDELRNAFSDLTREYIAALQSHELAALAAMPALTNDAVNAWVDATNVADEINGRRLSAREDLIAYMRAAT